MLIQLIRKEGSYMAESQIEYKSIIGSSIKANIMTACKVCRDIESSKMIISIERSKRRYF